MTRVPISALLEPFPGSLTARLDPSRVRRYADNLKAMPPVVIFSTKRGLILADGCHRVAAAKSLGLQTVEAEVRQGTAQDALRYAVTVGARDRALTEEQVLERILERSRGRGAGGQKLPE